MRVLRWGIDLAQLYTNGGTGMCIGLQSSLEGTGVAISSSGPFENLWDGGGGGGVLDHSQNPSDKALGWGYGGWGGGGASSEELIHSQATALCLHGTVFKNWPQFLTLSVE